MTRLEALLYLAARMARKGRQLQLATEEDRKADARERKRISHRRWRINNREKYNAYKRERWHAKRRTTPASLN